MNIPLLITDLSVAYPGHKPLFEHLGFELKQGEYIGLSGPSGVGKTTFLRLCAGLFGLDHEVQVSGQILYNESLDLLNGEEQLRKKYRRDHVSMITENPVSGLHPQRNIKDSWAFYGVQGNLFQYLDTFQFPDPNRIANAYPHELSGGEAQRIRLAFALAKNPEILLLESPTVALDKQNADIIWAVILDQLSNGTSVIHVDHNIGLIKKHADQHIRLGKQKESSTIAFTKRDLTGSPTIFELKNLNLSYKNHKVLEDVNIELKQGENLAVVGPSGVGKSSLGKAVSGLVPASGDLQLNGESLKLSSSIFDHVDTRIQYIWQEPRLSLNPSFTVQKLLNSFCEKSSFTPLELLDLVSLEAAHINKKIFELSTGQQQRLAIAVALASNPKVIVCDEITSGLDESKRTAILEMLADLQERLGLVIIFITHDENIADRYAHQVLRLASLS